MNTSRSQIEKFTNCLVEKGWSKEIDGTIEQYQSPRNMPIGWVIITVRGRRISTITNWHTSPRRGIDNARSAASVVNIPV